MSDNYPPGAAHDPRAPYNEPITTETEVCMTDVLAKTASILGCHDDDDAIELRQTCQVQHRTPYEIIKACSKICLELLAEHRTYFAGYIIRDLILDCEDWEPIEFKVELT
jgi:hypothetical protein